MAKIVCISWAIFQLLLPSFIVLDSIVVRAIHLAFAVAIGLITTMTPSKNTVQVFIKVGVIVIAVMSMLYIIMDWEGIALRSGRPLFRDVFMGLVGVSCLLVVTRRKIGVALPIVVVVFTLYIFFAPYMVDLLSFQGASITKYVTQVYLSTEGIYGIPLGVSASIVYLFVLLGAMMEKAGAGQFFINIALSLLGKYRGGPAKAAVASSGLMGMMSGSSIANVVTTGVFTIPLMKKVGYPAKKAAAIEVAASTDGQLMPPIMGAAAFIIAEYVNIPYFEVVKAAIIPALASNIALMYITHLEALKLGIKGLAKPDIPNLLYTLKSGWYFLVPIIVLMIQLFVMRHSPGRAAFWTIVVLMGIIYGAGGVSVCVGGNYCGIG
jgi:TRAP transporter 4TM/12TM fusion protein